MTRRRPTPHNDTAPNNGPGLLPALTAALLATALLAGCGNTTKRRPTSTPARAASQPQKIYAGEVGVLPAPTRTHSGPALTLPKDALTIPGRFPLNSIVAFNVPVRNDGRHTLRIDKLDPG